MLARRGPKKWIEVRNYCEPLGLGSTFDQVGHLIFQRVPISLLYAGKVLGAPLWGSLVSCGRLAIGQHAALARAGGGKQPPRRLPAGCQPAPLNAGDSTLMSRTQGRN